MVAVSCANHQAPRAYAWLALDLTGVWKRRKKAGDEIFVARLVFRYRSSERV